MASSQAQTRHRNRLEDSGFAQNVRNNASASLDDGYEWEAMRFYALEHEQNVRPNAWTAEEPSLEHNYSWNGEFRENRLVSASQKRKRHSSDTSRDQQPVQECSAPKAKRAKLANGYLSTSGNAQNATEDMLESILTSNNLDFQEARDILSQSDPILPNPSDRVVNLLISNPYADEELSEHPRLTSESDPVILPKETWVDGTICANGLVKFRLQFNNDKVPQTARDILGKQRLSINNPPEKVDAAGDVSYLPPDFGRGLRLDEMDMRLFKFCNSPIQSVLDASELANRENRYQSILSWKDIVRQIKCMASWSTRHR